MSGVKSDFHDLNQCFTLVVEDEGMVFMWKDIFFNEKLEVFFSELKIVMLRLICRGLN